MKVAQAENPHDSATSSRRGLPLLCDGRLHTVNSIFAKLGLSIDDSVDRRVKAVLMFLDPASV